VESGKQLFNSPDDFKHETRLLCFADLLQVKLYIHFYKYKVVVSLCLFVNMSDHTCKEPCDRVASLFVFGNCKEPRKCFYLGLKVEKMKGNF